MLSCWPRVPRPVKTKVNDQVRQIPLDLPVDFVMMLDAFCKAHHDASRKTIVQNAVTEMIRRELDESESLKKRYDAALAEKKRAALNVVPIQSDI